MTVTPLATSPPTTRSAAARPAAEQDILPRLGPDEHVPVPSTLSFQEMLNALNPLQHLPVVGTIYRAVTGEQVNPALRVLGAGVLGGPIGMLSTAVFAALEEFTAANRSPAQGATETSRIG
ncbi:MULTISPECIES: hypothetical protein [Roseomonadaceae]|uniref:Uncharacterized protein n=1 Tax=Falsiroseomonas oleicola TaxID=2801474 RepID=A0ABS6HCC0_9PROT|nr:hypothetical protein [Roseomonas oleicola]MBU8546380.1 hypothetical protein [Roseomonas oleicola]